MKTIPVGTFNATCLALMDEVQATREPILITKNCKPVAQLVPVEAEHDEIFGFYQGRGKIIGDIESPVIPAEELDQP